MKKLNKILIDHENGKIKINDLEIASVIGVKTETTNFYKQSKVELSFLADVTIIPPKRNENGEIIYPKK